MPVSFLCPLCKQPLTDSEKSLLCPNRHCFDKAKSGYVNLLPDGSKNSKLPGDNKLMVDARRRFLEKGYYEPLRRALCAQAGKLLAGMPSPVVLDAGCGEGYYTDGIEHILREHCKKEHCSSEVLGVDISKFALNAAAKQNKYIRYAVGSIFHLPAADASCDAVLNLFAPYCGEEFQRVLKPGGLLFLVIPDKKHLWELKQAVYDVPYENEPKETALEGFTLHDIVPVQERIALSCAEDIQNLFTMTPYYYKTSAENTTRLQTLQTLETEIAFQLLIYRKN